MMNKRFSMIACMILLTLIVGACSNPAAVTDGNGESNVNNDTEKEEIVVDNPFHIGTEFTQEEVKDFLRVDEHLYEKYFELTEEEAVIPALLQDYVPQGMTLMEDQNWLVISHYSSEKGRPTILTVLDNSTGELIKVFKLYNADKTPYTGHAGGITLGEQYLWVASEGKVRRVSREEIITGEEPELTFSKEFEVDSRASFVHENEGVLWVGDFALAKTHPTPETHHMINREGKQHTGWIAGYKLDEATEDIINSEEAGAGQLPRPDYLLSIPEKVQGVAIMDDKIILSSSYGRNNTSSLLIFKNSLKEEPHTFLEGVYDEKIPLWFLDGEEQIGELIMPPSSENIVNDDQKLYILFESGANAYRVSGSYPLLRIQTMKNELLDSITMP